MKMKLRRRREEKEHYHHAFCLHQAAAAARAPLRSRSPLPFIFPSSPSSAPPARNLPFQLVGRHVSLQLSLSSCSASPFLLHKITEAARYGIRRVALYSTCRPNLPVQLAGLAIAAPSSPHPCPFTKSGAGSSPVLMASSLWRVEP